MNRPTRRPTSREEPPSLSQEDERLLDKIWQNSARRFVSEPEDIEILPANKDSLPKKSS
jgi:hypothetical protein